MNSLVCGDFLDGIRDIRAGSVAMVFADLPYGGRTSHVCGNALPFDRLWEELNRVCRPDAAMVFTAMQPFASLLVCSNLKAFRYEMVWKKNKPRGFLNAKNQPLRVHESVLVFYRRPAKYRPQMSEGHEPVHGNTKHPGRGGCYGTTTKSVTGGGSTRRYPTSVLEIPVVNGRDQGKIHPTQKPEDLPAYFIRTYTEPGDLVLDPTAGSGTTLVAAKKLGRRFIGFELDPVMAWKARLRLGVAA